MTVPQARDNLRTMILILQAQGARVLLVREAVAPDPSVLEDYGRMLARLGEERDVGYLDAASVMVQPTSGDLFLDDCHLTWAGHVVLARLVADALVQRGWIAPR